jgi:hypothetical protein
MRPTPTITTFPNTGAALTRPEFMSGDANTSHAAGKPAEAMLIGL